MLLIDNDKSEEFMVVYTLIDQISILFWHFFIMRLIYLHAELWCTRACSLFWLSCENI